MPLPCSTRIAIGQNATSTSPFHIPPIPDGWCASQERLTTFVEFINTNFELIINLWCQTFEEDLELPGMPPITLISPTVNIPGLAPIRSALSTGIPPLERAFTGNRFRVGVPGGTVDAEFEFGGFEGRSFPGRSLTIPGVSPTRIINEWLQMNYQIIQDKFDEKGLEPFSFVPQFDCDLPPDQQVAQINQVNDEVVGGLTVVIDDPDGPALPGSSVPTFGTGTGGTGSCYDVTNGTMVDEPLATEGLAFSVLDGDGEVVLRCSCAVQGAAIWTVDFTADYSGACAGPGVCDNKGARLSWDFWQDASCLNHLGSGSQLLINGSGPFIQCVGVAIVMPASTNYLTFSISVELISALGGPREFKIYDVRAIANGTVCA